MHSIPASALAAALMAVAAAAAGAEPSTVCTITVNSADERESLRRHLPEDRFRFVELVERGRADWLASACRAQVRCDVLVVSGHFAGREFYSSNFDVQESLPVDEMERVACGDGCPGLFSGLKEVYLFGCDSLKPEPVKSATPEVIRGLVRAGVERAEAERIAAGLSERHGEASRERMRRVFAGVPLIYGFSSLAPYGRVAGPMLDRYFESGTDVPFGSGLASAKLLRIFGPSSMVATAGLDEADPHAAYRREECRFHDERVARAEKVAAWHRRLGGDWAELRMGFDGAEAFFAALSPEERREPSVSSALDTLAGDRPARDRYIAVTRETADPALRVRMIALARNIGWLGEDEGRAELGRLAGDLVAAASTGFGEVDLVCSLNREGGLDAAVPVGIVAKTAAQAAALACLGRQDARERVLRALASADENEVQVAQAYLRHRPIAEADEVRSVVRRVAGMKATSAQVRALEALARLHLEDGEALGELARLFARANSARVQQAIAEVFIRARLGEVDASALARVLRTHRIPVTGGSDLVEHAVRKLSST